MPDTNGAILTPDQMAFDWQPLRKLGFGPGLFVHYMVAVVGSFIIGFFPEAILGSSSSILGSYSPFLLLTAGCLGFLLNRKLGHTAASWIWPFGVAWLVFGAYGDSTYWYNSGSSSRMRYVLDNFFGSGHTCEASECLGVFFFTTPCAMSIIYSVTAAFGLRSFRKGTVDQSGFPVS